VRNRVEVLHHIVVGRAKNPKTLCLKIPGSCSILFRAIIVTHPVNFNNQGPANQ